MNDADGRGCARFGLDRRGEYTFRTIDPEVRRVCAAPPPGPDAPSGAIIEIVAGP